MRYWRFHLYWLLILAVLQSSSVAMGADAVVVRPAAWSTSLESWLQYRRQQGYEVVELDSHLGRDGIRQAIGQLERSNPGKLRFVLLAGDVGKDPGLSIAPFYHTSTAMVQFGGDPTIATDNPYADLNNDGAPDLAIGRIPADSPAQLENVLRRVITYEQQRDFSVWRRNIHVVAGVGGFGFLADSIIESTTRQFLSSRIPGWSHVSMTQASLSSNYCPDPYQFCDSCIERMNDGGMFWVYIGHGHVKHLDYLRADQQFLPIFSEENVPQVNVGARAPIAIFLACYTGAFDATEDSLAEKLVLSDTGPVAALAASRVSGPYGLAMLSDGLLTGCYDDRVATLGEVVLQAKRRMLAVEPQPQKNRGQMQLVRGIAKALSPEDYDLNAEHQEHVWQMNLLGDPMLRLSHPTEIELSLPDRAAPGEQIAVSGQVDAPGKLVVELAYRRGNVSPQVTQVPIAPLTGELRQALQRRYLQANDAVIQTKQNQTPSGPFQIELTVPPDLPRGKYSVRVFHEAQESWQVGYGELSIRKPRAVEAAENN